MFLNFWYFEQFTFNNQEFFFLALTGFGEDAVGDVFSIDFYSEGWRR